MVTGPVKGRQSLRRHKTSPTLWSPRHDLSAGLGDTVRWYLASTGWIERIYTGAYRERMATSYEGR